MSEGRLTRDDLNPNVLESLRGPQGEPGQQGPPGEQGPPGKDAEVTTESIEGALGFVPTELQIATESTLGGIKPDGETITVDPETGIASAVGGGGLADTSIIKYGMATGNYYRKTVTVDGITEYVDGIALALKIQENTDSTLNSQLDVNGLGPMILRYSNGTNYPANLLKKDSIYTVRYSASTSSFILQGEGFGLLDSITTSSTLYAATANAVKQVNDLKANKQQQSSLTPNGNASWNLSNSRYFKDEFGIVHFYLNATVGQKTEATFISTGLPVGYRPTFGLSQPFTVYASGTTPKAYPNALNISTGGDLILSVPIPSDGTTAYGYFSFKTTV